MERRVKHYNLELIISIGYRVRSHRGTQFRRWATERLNEYLVKGFTMDDERLKDMRIPHTGMSKEFFATVQNKLHFAIHGHTAAELIAERASAEKDNMGLTSWKGDKVRKADVSVAKNYLTDKEIQSLNRIVNMYLDYAEDQAERQSPMFMKDWIDKLNSFLKFNEREILTNAGKISQEVAEKLAAAEYEKFNHQRLTLEVNDDFDDFVKQNRLHQK